MKFAYLVIAGILLSTAARADDITQHSEVINHDGTNITLRVGIPALVNFIELNGDVNIDGSLLLGPGSTAAGLNSVSIGTAVHTDGNFSMAIGASQTISSPNSFAVGSQNQVGGVFSAVVGTRNDVFGTASFAGGLGNTLAAGAQEAFVAGRFNVVGARGDRGLTTGMQSANHGEGGLVAGYRCRVTGPWSFASGYRARGMHDHVFVWSDGSAGDFDSAQANSFNIRAANGVRIESAAGLRVNGSAVLTGSEAQTLIDGALNNLLILPQGNLSMGPFTSGPTP